MKKRVLSVLCSLLLALSLFAGTAAVAEDAAPLEATTFPLMNGLGLGQLSVLNDQRAYVYPESAHNDASVTATTVESLTGVSNRPMLQLNATNKQVLGVEFNYKTADNSAFQFVTGFNSSQAFMFYVKAPLSTENTRIWMRMKTVPDQALATGTERYIFIEGGKPFYTLAKGATQWATATSPENYCFEVAAGFEGWIRVPSSSYTADFYSYGEYNYDWLYNVEFRFGEVGGAAGAAVVGAPLIVMKDSDATMIKVDGAAEEVDLFTGKTAPKPLEATTFPLMNGFGLGQLSVLNDQRAYVYPEKAHTDASVTATSVESLTGVSNRPMLQLNATNKQELGVEFNYKTADNSAFQFVTGFNSSKAFMFYVKAPLSTENTRIWMRMKTVPESATDTERHIFIEGGKPFYTLAKGATQWATATSPENYCFEVAAGFEGWIRVPSTSYTAEFYFYGEYGEYNYDRLYNVEFRFGEVGGDAGAAVVGAPLIVMKDSDATMIKVDGAAEEVDLFTGKTAPKPLEATTFPLMNGFGLGQLSVLNDHRAYVYPESAHTDASVTATTVESLTGVSNRPMLQLNATNKQVLGVEFNYKTADNTAFQFVTGFNSSQAFMFYVKAPLSTENTRIWMRMKTVPESATDTERHIFIEGGKPFYTLAKGATQWATATSPENYYFEVAAGFEGWIRVPSSSYTAEFYFYGEYGEYNYDWLYNVEFRFGEVGGAAGAAVVGAPLIVMKDSESTKIKVDGAETAVDVLTAPPVSVAGNSISLGEKVDVNFHLALDDEVVGDDSLKITVDGKETALGTPDAQGNYVFTCAVAAKEMTKNVAVNLTWANGAASKTYNYSAKAYADYILANADQYANEVPLIKAMLNYGGYAQTYFNHNTDNMANAGLDADVSSVTAETLKDYAVDLPDDVYGTSLVLNAETTLKLYFKTPGTITVNDVPTAAVANGSLWQVSVPGITAKNLDNVITIVKDGETIDVTPLSYVHKALTVSDDADLQNVMKALYLYNQAAADYSPVVQ